MYRFSLEAVLNHRRHIEDLLQKEFAKRQKDLFDEQERLSRLESSHIDSMVELQRRQEEGMRVSGITLYSDYIKQTAYGIERSKHRISELEDRRHRKREELIEAMKSRMTLEKLKEKEWKLYKRRLDRNERIVMGEIAVSGYNMRKSSE